MLVALLGVFGLANLRNSGTQQAGTATPPAAHSSGSAVSELDKNERTIRLLTDFLSGEPDDPVTLSTPIPDRKWTLETMIFCVPNPVESAVAYYFDPVIESFQQGMSSQGLILDRYFMPWHEFQLRVAADPKLRISAKEREFHNEPGALLFRHRSLRKLVLVFLVGESPLWGASKHAFAKSTRFILKTIPSLKNNHFKDRLEYDDKRPLGVLGPFFSGSADSLTLAVADALREHSKLKIRVLSGSVYNVDKNVFEERACKNQDRIVFHSACARSDLRRYELIRYVYEHQVSANAKVDVAWLTESNTGFGLVDQLEENPVQATSNPKQKPGQKPIRLSKIPNAIEGMARISIFPFPMHISRVRGIFSAAAESAKNDFPDIPSSWNHVKIPFADEEPARDVLPEFAPMMTASSAELVLKQIVSAISRRRFSYIGITATDLRDCIFLGGLVREHCPDAQLLVVVPDLLYTHPQSRAALKGALVASSYPLTDTRRRERPEHKSADPARGNPNDPNDRPTLHFNADWSQGIFNAAVILLDYDKFDANLDSRHGRVFRPLAVRTDRNLRGFVSYYRVPNQYAVRSQPAIWVSVVGDDTLWPLQCRSIYDSACGLMRPENQDEEEGQDEHIQKKDKHTEKKEDQTQWLWDWLDPDTKPNGPQKENLPSKDETLRREFAELVGYTFSTWVDLQDWNGTFAPGRAGIKPQAIRTHLDAFDRTLFFLVLFFGAYEIVQMAHGKTIWTRSGHASRNLQFYISALCGLACITSSCAFVALLAAIHVADVLAETPWPDSPLSLMIGSFGAIVLYESIGLLYVKPLEWRRIRPRDKAKVDRSDIQHDLAIVLIILSIAGLFALNLGRDTHSFLRWLDFALLVFASIVTAGLVRAALPLLAEAKESAEKWFVRKSPLRHGLSLVRRQAALWTMKENLLRYREHAAAIVFNESINARVKRIESRLEKIGSLQHAIFSLTVAKFVLVVSAPARWTLNWVHDVLTLGDSGDRGVGLRAPDVVALVVAVLPIVAILCLLWWCPLPTVVASWFPADVLTIHLFFDRTAHSLSGVSLWKSWLLLTICLYLSAFARARGLTIATEMDAIETPWPCLKKDRSNSWTVELVRSLQEPQKDIRRILVQPSRTLLNEHRTTTLVLLGATLLWFAMLRTKLAPGMYDGVLSWWLWTLLSVFFVIWMYWLDSFVVLLKAIENLFDKINSLPIRRSFERLPLPLSHLFGRQSLIGGLRRIRTDDFRVPVRFVNSIERRYRRLIDTNRAWSFKASGSIGSQLKTKRENKDWDKVLADGLRENGSLSIHRCMNEVARGLLTTAVMADWQRRDVWDVMPAEDEKKQPKSAEKGDKQPVPVDPESEIVGFADDFLATQFILYCNPLLRYALWAFWSIAVSTLLFLLAIASYAAQPQGFFGTTSIAMIATLGVLTAIIVWKLERNELLSRVSGTTPGKIDLDAPFLLQAGLLLLIPVVVLINYAFPGAFDWTETLLSPILHVMR